MPGEHIAVRVCPRLERLPVAFACGDGVLQRCDVDKLHDCVLKQIKQLFLARDVVVQSAGGHPDFASYRGHCQRLVAPFGGNT